MMTRAEHLAWSKERALEYLPSDPQQAGTSFISDLNKHDELRDHAVQELIFMHMMAGLASEKEIRNLISGTN